MTHRAPPPLPPSRAPSSTPSPAPPTASPSARSTTLSYTWAELADRVAAAAGALRAHGVRPGDTVALLLTNRPELWVADLAVTMCGATTCPLYTTLPPNDVEYVLADAGARLVVTERALLAGTRGVALPCSWSRTLPLDGDPVDLRRPPRRSTRPRSRP